MTARARTVIARRAASLAILGLAVGLVAGCAGPPSDAGGREVASASPRRGAFERTIMLTGELEAVRSVAIKAPQTTLFQMRIQFMAEEGEVVQAGDPLLTFDSSALVAQVDDLESRILDARTQVVAKRAEMASSLKDLEIEVAERAHAAEQARLLAAVEPDVLARKTWAERQLQASKAARELDETRERIRLTRERGQAELDVLIIQAAKLEQDLRAAQEGLDLLTIRAPSPGIVVHERRQESQQRYQEGDSCWPGQEILRLPDLSEMRVVFAVAEVDVPLLRPGQPVTMELDALPGRPIEGSIESIPSMAVKRADDSKITIFRVRAALAETWADEMKPGMSVRGTVVVERHEDVPLVRRDAVRVDADGTWWWPATAPPGRALSFTPLSRNATDYLLAPEDHARMQALGKEGA